MQQKKSKKKKDNNNSKKLGLHLRLSLLKDKTKFGQIPLQCLSWN